MGRIADTALDIAEEKFLASSGPGGQNVNKVATAVQLRVNVFRLGMPPEAFERLKEIAGSKLTKGGEIVLTLQESALELGFPFRVGVSHSKDSFYSEIEPDRQPLSSQLTQRWQAWRAAGAICSEMEASALFILASLHGKRAGGVMTMVAENEGLPTDQDGEEQFPGDRAIRTAIEGVKRLIEKDRRTATS